MVLSVTARICSLLILLSAACLAPNAVFASCGDYLNLQHPASPPMKSPVVPLCRGPHCQPTPLPLHSDQHFAPVRVVEQQAWTDPVSPPQPELVQPRCAIADALPVQKWGVRIERPPAILS